MHEETLYLDHAATTPLRPEARTAMVPYLEGEFGNPSSVHGPGRTARAALEEARERVASAIGARPDEIVFTGGGTEADNLAVLGRWRSERAPVVISAIEHSAVRHAAAQAAREGAAVTTVAVDRAGRLDLAALEESLEGAPPAVVSVMWANNEVGSIQELDEVVARCAARGIAVHTDAVQAVGHVPVSVEEVGVHLLAMSAHKFGGPRGVGALYVRVGTRLEPLLHGGGQESGRRAGTSNVAGAVGMAAALERSVNTLDGERARLGALRDRLQARLVQAVPDLDVNAATAHRLPHLLSVGFDAVAPDVLLPALDLQGLAVSSGSACHSGASSPSHVLVAMGRDHRTVVRFSLGWTTTEEEVDRAASIFVDTVARTRDAIAAGAPV